jgi:hypothetical protein
VEYFLFYCNHLQFPWKSGRRKLGEKGTDIRMAKVFWRLGEMTSREDTEKKNMIFATGVILI